MNLFKFLALGAGLIGCLLFTGCGSSSTGIQPITNAAAAPMGSAPAKYVAGVLNPGKTDIPTHIVNAVTGHLDAELRKRKLAPEGEATSAIRIDATATYYRMRSGFARMGFGMLAGKDGIQCDVQLIDQKSGHPVGQFKVSSYNLTAIGGEDDVARMLAVEIAKALENHKH
jgi:hypothetical protein